MFCAARLACQRTVRPLQLTGMEYVMSSVCYANDCKIYTGLRVVHKFCFPHSSMPDRIAISLPSARLVHNLLHSTKHICCGAKGSMTWVQILEPETKNLMYANVETGECQWEPPPDDVPV